MGLLYKRGGFANFLGEKCGCFSDHLTWSCHRIADGCFSEPLYGDITENKLVIGAWLLVRPMIVSLTIPHVNKLC